MTFRTLIFRSLRFHWRAHLGVLLGAVVGSAALIGALIVGDSVRGSLRDMALQRLGWVEVAMGPNDRFFTADLARYVPHIGSSFGSPSTHLATLLALPATVSRQDGSARANQINLLGIDRNFFETNAYPPWAKPLLTNARPVSTFAGWTNYSSQKKAWQSNIMPSNSVVLNQALAAQLQAQPGDEVVFRLPKLNALSRDVPITPQSDSSVALRLKVYVAMTPSEFGNFSLQPSQVPPLNAFMRVDELESAADLHGKRNVLLSGAQVFEESLPPWHKLLLRLPSWLLHRLPERLLESAFKPTFTLLISETHADILSQSLAITLADVECALRSTPETRAVELHSQRIFLDPPIVKATESLANGQPILSYFVNQFRAGTNTTPYSMVTAAGQPWTPPEMKDDEILVNQWLAKDLQIKPGDTVDLSYFLPESAANLIEATNRFRVRAVVPLETPTAKSVQSADEPGRSSPSPPQEERAGERRPLFAPSPRPTGRGQGEGSVHGKVIYADPTLMPDFPGIAKAESTHNWDAGFPLVHKIRDKDEEYWKKYRGTPKAFVTLTAGQKMWGNRFGNLTAIRWPVPPGMSSGQFQSALESNLLARLNPADFGLRFEPVRAQALAAANQGQDFGQLFLGFSFFLILAALILMALLFQFGLEQRMTEVGTLLALGFTPKQVRRLFLAEATALAFLGGIIGVLAGAGYAWAMLQGLTGIWREAVHTSALSFHASGFTIGIGLLASTIISALTIALVLRKQAKRPARELLTEGAGVSPSPPLEERAGERRPQSAICNLQSAIREVHGEGSLHSTLNTQLSTISIGGIALLGALALILWALARGDTAPGLFFGSGALLLIAGLTFSAALLDYLSWTANRLMFTISSLGIRGCTRRRKRSLATIALLACGSFIIVAVGANRLEAGRDAQKRSSGTGGFALIGQSTLPVVHDLNTERGRDFFGLDNAAMTGVKVVPLRVHDGDDASCLNLNRAQKPRLLGVDPALLAERNAFTFAKAMKGLSAKEGWNLLRSQVGPNFSLSPSDGERVGVRGLHSQLSTLNSQLPDIPAIGDQNSILWAMGKKVGDTIDYVDEHGRPFRVRLVGAVANSILQGSLLISEDNFRARFPGESGYRMFLIDAPSNQVAAVASTLTRALQDVGLELTPAAQRLAEFNAVQNTYLNTFQILGGLGLLLGSAGLGLVVLRNVLERRGELALLQAVGFRQRTLQWLVLSEHGGLLWLGLGIGIAAAAVATLPVLLSPGAEVHYLSLGVTLAAVLLNGMGWTWLATRFALRGELLAALRNE